MQTVIQITTYRAMNRRDSTGGCRDNHTGSREVRRRRSPNPGPEAVEYVVKTDDWTDIQNEYIGRSKYYASAL
jgi:hypothetical protein